MKKVNREKRKFNANCVTPKHRPPGRFHQSISQNFLQKKSGWKCQLLTKH